MNVSIDRYRDYYAGGLMALIGLGTIVQSSRYDIGTSEMLGSGFFPMALGCILLAIGVLIFVSAGNAATTISGVQPQEANDVGSPEWRGWLCIIAGTLCFMFFAEKLGLLAATFSCVFISALGDRTSTLKNALLLAFGISVFGVALFSYGLKIPIPAVIW